MTEWADPNDDLTLGSQRVETIKAWYPHALVGANGRAQELAVLKVQLEDGSERLVSFPSPPK